MSVTLMMLEFGAVADAEDRQAVRDVEKTLHDRLIESTGAARRSGVSWREIPADDEGAERWLVDHVGEDADGLRAFLRDNPAGLLIIASCEVVS